MESHKHNLGQYFTKDPKLKQTIWDFIFNKESLLTHSILEPSLGQGHLVEFIQEKNPAIKFDMYEIDETIELLPKISALKSMIKYEDFLKSEIDRKYMTIIGNPPYVKIKKGNLYIDFIERCYGLLEEKGELIFIVPSDFFKVTHANKLINMMMKHGTFTHIYHPHKENLFEDASIDIVVFRYYKDATLELVCNYNDRYLTILNNNGIITFTDNNLIIKPTKIVQDYFDVYVGMVTGKEKVFKNEEFGNIELLTKKNKKEKYILIKNFPTENEKLNNYFLENKKELIERKIKKMTENNWFEWGALRNMKAIEKHKGEPCIYMYNLTRQPEVAFVGNVDYFGGNLLMMVPKSGIHSDIDINKWVAYLNTDQFKKNYIYSKRFKIGQKQLCNANIFL